MGWNQSGPPWVVGITSWQTAAEALVSGDGNGNSVSVGVKWVSGDMSVAIQAAIDAVWTVSQAGGEVVLSDCAIYQAQGLVLKPRVNLRGMGATFSEVHTSQAAAPQALRGTMLRMFAGSTLPLLSNFLPTSASLRNGYQRATSNVLNAQAGSTEVDGAGVVVATNSALPQWYQASTIEGITFDGNAPNQTAACSILYFERAWSVAIKNCNVINSNYFGIVAIDCNSFQIDSVWSHYAPWFLYDTADTQIRNCTISGSLYYAHALWLHGNQCWLNQLGNNLVYNSSLNTEAQWTNPGDTSTVRIRRSSEGVTGIDGVTNTQFAITSHRLYDEQPVVLSSTGTLPAGFFADRVYWVRRLNGNAIMLAENLNRRRAGVYVQATSAGSGVISIDRGFSANLVLSGGAQLNQVTGGRFDQAYGDGVLMVGAPNNNITCNVSQAGLGSTAARAGIRLRSGYVETQPVQTTLIASSGAVLAGLVSGSAGGNQTSGVVCDDVASEASINTVGLNVFGHTAANYTPGHIGARRRTLRQTNTPGTPRTSVGSAADQAFANIGSVVIPGKAVNGSLGKNGKLIITARVTSAGVGPTDFQFYLGGSAISGVFSMSNTGAATSYECRDHTLYANNSANSQKYFGTIAINVDTTVPATVLSIGMTSDQTLTVQARWPAIPAASETVTLDSWTVEIIESD